MFASNELASSMSGPGLFRTNTPTPCRDSTTPSDRKADTASRMTVLLTPNRSDNSASDPVWHRSRWAVADVSLERLNCSAR